MPQNSPWSAVPYAQRSTVRSYINSENEKDRETALALCQRYGLDYAAMRLVILAEMVAEWKAIEARRAEVAEVAAGEGR
jgi:hypothetical protein